MQLPHALSKAVETALEGVPLADLRRAAELLSARYRGEIRDGRRHLSDDLAARAYLGVRMPATYAAIRASLDAVAQLRPDFAPRSVLDAGAGPGTAVFAAQDCWPTVADALLIEASMPIRSLGERLMAAAARGSAQWIAHDLPSLPPHKSKRDLVMLAYVLDELPPEAIPALTARLWDVAGDMLVVVEPGTPGGWSRILTVRDQLIAAGAHIVAPCPHALECPLAPPDWCHFSRRVARSRMHRQIKSADVPWEDEKFIYIAASRTPVSPVRARVIAHPLIRGGTVSLKLCRDDGSAAQRLLSRREGLAFRQARRLAWGDAILSDRIIPSDSAVSS